MINDFKEIIQTISNDITAMNGGDDNESKRSLKARQECLNVEDPEECLEDLGEIVGNPSELLGGEKRSFKVRLNYMSSTCNGRLLISWTRLLERSDRTPLPTAILIRKPSATLSEAYVTFAKNSGPGADDTNSEISSLWSTKTF